MDSDSFEWSHIDDFDVAVQNVVFEVEEYILNRKWEVIQNELNFDMNPDDPFADAEPTDDLPPIDTADDVA